MRLTQTINPCLWFDDQAEAAAKLYVSIFPKSGIDLVSRFPAVGQEIHGRPAGSVMTVSFRLDGQEFTALNGGPLFKFNEAVSFQVMCDGQDEIDRYWTALGKGGDPKARQCGWLKDRFGLSWQIVPRAMTDMMSDPKAPGFPRVFAAMLKMKKLDLAKLERAYRGK